MFSPSWTLLTIARFCEPSSELHIADTWYRRTIHLRCVTTPDEAHKGLLDRLGLTLPQRLRRSDEVAQM